MSDLLAKAFLHQIYNYNRNIIVDCAGDKIEKNEMGWACGAYGWGEGGV